MVRDAWYSNTTWNEEIEAAFFERLKRARYHKPHYLRLQARTLTRTHPQVALRLLDLYFNTGQQTAFLALAHVDRANAYIALGQIDAAIAALQTALAREVVFPNVATRACFQLPKLVVIELRRDLYPRAREILDDASSRIAFPVDKYEHYGARALLLHDLHHFESAREYAELALEAAALDHSGIPRHPDVGLVTDIENDFHTRLCRVAGSVH